MRTKALLASGVRRVVLGSVDPNPSVDGGGKAFLVEHGVEVEVMDGEEAQMAAGLITDFWERMKAPLGFRNFPKFPKLHTSNLKFQRRYSNSANIKTNFTSPMKIRWIFSCEISSQI